MTSTYKPKFISSKFFVANMDQKVPAIPDISIAKIVIPDHLLPVVTDNISVNSISKKIRYYFNNTTPQSLVIIKPKLSEYMSLNMTSLENYTEIVDEIFENFLVNSEVINDYMELLNHVQMIQYDDNGKIKTVGNGFINKCGQVAHDIISYKKIRELASYNLSNDDDLDKYNRYKDRVKNLFLTICSLYDQRHITKLSVNIEHIYPLISLMINYFMNCMRQLSTLSSKHGSDLELTRSNESDINLFKKMSNIYAGFIYIFIKREKYNFLQDTNRTKQNETMSSIVTMFEKNIVPKITDGALLSLVNNNN